MLIHYTGYPAIQLGDGLFLVIERDYDGYVKSVHTLRRKPVQAVPKGGMYRRTILITFS
jgi:hypothetical protein